MEKEMQTFSFLVNGYDVEAVYATSFIETCIKPLLRSWSHEYKETGRRIVVLLAAPPAAGKSTLAALFAALASQMEDVAALQDLGMDGFHHYQRYILEHTVEVDGCTVPMKSVKGCPESFDYDRFAQLLKEIKTADRSWPFYNRKLHDVEDDVIQVTAPVVIIEGNYLLLDESPWKELHTLGDHSIFIEAAEPLLRQRLINRKMMGGMPPHEALAFCERSDLRNVKRILTHRLPADITFLYDGVTYQRKTKEDSLC